MRPSARIDTIVFDLGGVLVDWNPRYLYRKLIQDEAKIEEFLRDVCNHEWNEQQDAGRSFGVAIAERIRDFPQYESWFRAYHERWSEMLGGTFAESVDVLQKLRESGQYRIYALSNWSAETFPMARARFDFFKNFDGILISGEEKMVKPQLSFFRLLETRYGVVPERSVFIDDLERNLIPAREIGYRTIHVSDPAKIAESLRALKFDF